MQRYSSPYFQDENQVSGTSTPGHAHTDKFKAAPVQLTTWSHEAKHCTDEVVIDLALLPPGTKEGDIAELRTLGGETQQKILFVVKKPPEELTKLIPNLQVCKEQTWA